MSPDDPDSDDDLLDLGRRYRLLWRYRVLILLSCGIGGAAAAFLAITSVPVFRAEVVVTEARDGSMGAGSASISAQLGGLASLAGVNLPQSAGAGLDAQAVLESRRLVEQFIARNQLLPVLYNGASKPPTLWRAVKMFKEGILAVRKDARRGVTTVSVEWTDPAAAARWANGIVALANELIRTRALEDSNRNIAYLNAQLQRTNVSDIRRVMYNIIESETKTLMLANGRTEYAFEVIDPAVAPEIKVGPHRLVMVIVGVALGFVLGSLGAFLYGLRSRVKRGTGQAPPLVDGAGN